MRILVDAEAGSEKLSTQFRCPYHELGFSQTVKNFGTNQFLFMSFVTLGLSKNCLPRILLEEIKGKRHRQSTHLLFTLRQTATSFLAYSKGARCALAARLVVKYRTIKLFR